MASALPPTESWPHHPLYLKADAGTTVEDPDGACPVGVPFAFESDAFVGRLLFRVRGLHDDDDGYFATHPSVKNQFVIQGRFKRELRAHELVYGGEFARRLRRHPPAFIETIVQGVFDRHYPGVTMRLSADDPSALVNLPASVAALRADKEGEEPDLADAAGVVEDNGALLTPELCAEHDVAWPVDAATRRTLLRRPAVSARVTFDTTSVYTFEHHDDILDYKTYEMDLKAYQFDMSKIVDHEPFQIMSKNLSDGMKLWSFQIWHEKLTREDDGARWF